MKNKLLKFIDKIMRAKTWQKIVGTLSCVVVFCTVYALILPAITASDEHKLTSSHLVINPDVQVIYVENKDLFETTGGKLQFVIKKENEQFYTTYCYEFPDGVGPDSALLNGASHNLIDDNTGQIIGTYSFSTNPTTGRNECHIIFDQSYLNTVGDEIDGHIQFDAEIEKDRYDDQTQQIKYYENGQEITIPPNQISIPGGNNALNYNIITSKSYSGDGKNLKYKVSIKSTKGTGGNINVTDTISTDLNITGLKSITLSKNYSTITLTPVRSQGAVGGTPYSYYYNANEKKIYMNLPELNADERYDLEYEYNTSAMQEGKEYYAQNNIFTQTAKVQDSDYVDRKFGGNTPTQPTDKLQKQKYGTVDGSRIKWTITLNSDQKQDMSGVTVTDTMFKDMVGSINVEPANNRRVTYYNYDSSTQTLTFTNSAGKRKFTITYYTSLPDFAEANSQIRNTATIHVNGKDEYVNGIAQGGNPGSIYKDKGNDAVINQNKAIVNYKMNIKLPDSGLPVNKTFTDTMSSDLYLTKEQAIAFVDNAFFANTYDENGQWSKVNGFKLTDYFDVSFKGSNGTTYTIAQVRNNPTSITYTQITLKSKKALSVQNNNNNNTANAIWFRYDATANIINNKNIDSFTNTFKVDHVEASYTYKPDIPKITKKDGDGNTGTTTTASTDGTITWMVDIHLGYQASNTVTIKDTLPEGLTLKSFGYAGENQYNPETKQFSGTDSKGNSWSGTFNTTTREITVTITNSNGLPNDNTFVYVCDVDEAHQDGIVYTFANKVTVNINNNNFGPYEQTQNWHKEEETPPVLEMIDKTSMWDQDNQRLNFSVDINPGAENISEIGDTISVYDILTYYTGGNSYSLSLILDLHSVRLYEIDENGKKIEIENWEHTLKTLIPPSGRSEYQKLTGEYLLDNHICEMILATMPDETHLRFEYSYDMHMSDPNGYFEANSWAKKQLSIKNKLNILGTEFKDETDFKTEHYWDVSHTSGGVQSNKSFHLYKVDKTNYSITIPNTEFTLYKYNGTQFVNTNAKYRTDEKGVLIIDSENDSNISKNTAYYLIETAAASPYILPTQNDRQKVYFYFSDDTVSSTRYPADFLTSEQYNAIDVNGVNRPVYVENDKPDSAKLTVKKRWYGEDGNLISGNDIDINSISFDLYQVEKEYSSTDDIPGQDISVGGPFKVNIGYGQWNLTENLPEFMVNGGDKIKIYVEKDGLTPDARRWSDSLGYWDRSKSINYDIVENNYVYTISNISENINVGILSNDHPMPNVTYEIISATPSPQPDTGQDGENGPVTRLYLSNQLITKDKNWTWYSASLPKTGKDVNGKNVYYTYYVQEKDGTGYHLLAEHEYDNNDTENGSVNNTIYINNQKDNDVQYELPMTGGIGTKIFTTVGALMMTCAMAMYIKKTLDE